MGEINELFLGWIQFVDATLGGPYPQNVEIIFQEAIYIGTA